MYPGKYAAETPEKPAAVNAVTGEVLTYRRLNEDSIRLARYLRSVGLRARDQFGEPPRIFCGDLGSATQWSLFGDGEPVSAVP